MPIKARNIEPINARSIPFTFNQVKCPPMDKCILSCIGDTVSAKAADIVSATDYSPFGAPLAGRTFSSNGYRFGFNSKEVDNETYGDGNAYDFGARIYDSRLGRWLSVDPLEKKYPGISTYNFCINNPIIFKDTDGKDFIYSVYKNDQGVLTVQISTTVFLYGTDAAKVPDKDFYYRGYTNVKIMNQLGIVEDKPVLVIMNIKYVNAITAENSLSKLTDKNGNSTGNNRMEVIDKTEIKSKSLTFVAEVAIKGAQDAFLFDPNDYTAKIHGTLHNMGFGDRYDKLGLPITHYGFEGTFMSGENSSTKMHPINVNDIAFSVLSETRGQKGTGIYTGNLIETPSNPNRNNISLTHKERSTPYDKIRLVKPKK
jgi:RHS repeat-associated protein